MRVLSTMKDERLPAATGCASWMAVRQRRRKLSERNTRTLLELEKRMQAPVGSVNSWTVSFSRNTAAASWMRMPLMPPARLSTTRFFSVTFLSGALMMSASPPLPTMLPTAPGIARIFTSLSTVTGPVL